MPNYWGSTHGSRKKELAGAKANEVHMRTLRAPRYLRASTIGALAVAVLFAGAPMALGHGVSGGPLGPQQVNGPAGTAGDAATQDHCDPIDPHACLLPFPNDYFTVADPTTATGRRLNLSPLAMPRNLAEKPIDPTEWNRNDGFSPGQLALTYVPGLDPSKTALPPITKPQASMGAGSAVVAIDATTGKRQPVWAELDASDTGKFGGGNVEGNQLPGTSPLYDPANSRALLIRPAVNWQEGHHYVIVVQNARDASGNRIPSSDVFAAYRDKKPTPLGLFDARRAQMESVFGAIAGSHGPKINRSDIYLAWDFTVASGQNLAERMLSMRDDAFSSLGGGVPSYKITSVTDNPGAGVLRRIQGSFDVPRYVSTDQPGAFMVYKPGTNIPMRQPTPQSATFTCNVPTSAVASDGSVHPSAVSLYGHGLLGDQSEVNSDAEVGFGQLYDWTFCATDWLGMSSSDLPVVAGVVIPDLSNFHLIPDRNQQGILDFLFLGRLLRDPRGFAADAAFRRSGTPLIDPATLTYYGNSQGGIMGGAVTAVATDLTRSVLGVPGMNYSTLLTRSSDFDTFAALLYPMYPDGLDRNITMSLLQILWDRGEANGYAEHMTTKPYAHTPSHSVLLEAAFGDHQVSNYAVEVEAATIGAAAHVPASPNHWGDPSFGWFSTLSAQGGGGTFAYPYTGSALMEWDSGVPAPPLSNTPNRAANDPHETPRRDPRARQQMDTFLRTGVVTDVCTGSGTAGVSATDGSCQTVKRDGPAL
jgi:hypothetical protein